MNAFKLKKRLLTIAMTFTILLLLAYARTAFLFPQNLLIMQGKEYTFDFNTPINVALTPERSGIFKVNGKQISENFKVSLLSPVRLQSDEIGEFNLRLKLFGRIPLKDVVINVVPETKVIPCGNTVGVRIFTDGVLIVGVSKVHGDDGKDYKPYHDAGIDQGDTILEVDGKKLEQLYDLSEIVQGSNGKTLHLKVKHDENIKDAQITPIKSSDSKYKLGLWVRDSTAGIGTLTFYDSNTNKFGALGHGITDIDTGKILAVGKGDILESSIISVKKGVKGNPGELKGIFLNEDFKKGVIAENNEHGIYGKVTSDSGLTKNAAIPVALRSEVEEGTATILSNIDGRKVESFTIEIQKVFKQNSQNSKGMIIKITDKRLLEITGGIVQGMSGSPIIQKGKLVGAVTHVFVNDPTKGYGIFSELMIQSINKIK